MTLSMSSPQKNSKQLQESMGLKLTFLSQKRSGQKWTIAGRYKQVDVAQGHAPTPGPGAYTPDTHVIKGTPPKFSITPRRDIKESSIVVPGPGAYLGPGDPKLKTQIPVSLQSRHFPKDGRGDLPGPGQYTPDNPIFMSPQWTLGGKCLVEKTENSPGPSAYSPEKPKMSRATFLHPRVKDQVNSSSLNPGPGAYNVPSGDYVRPKAPSYSLAPRTTHTLDYASESPGPGAYNTLANFSHTKMQSPKFSITPRRDVQENSITPGPGAYSPSSLTMNTGPRSGIGVGHRFPARSKEEIPGPGQYDPKIDFYSVKEGKPAFSLSSRNHAKSVGSSFPGPGQYTPRVEAVKPSSPRHSLHGRLSMPTGNADTPGPHHYTINRPSSSPAFTLKSRTYFGKNLVTPSPAAYGLISVDATTKPRSPAYSLGGRLEYKPSSNETPGPGAYDAAFTF